MLVHVPFRAFFFLQLCLLVMFMILPTNDQDKLVQSCDSNSHNENIHMRDSNSNKYIFIFSDI